MKEKKSNFCCFVTREKNLILIFALIIILGVLLSVVPEGKTILELNFKNCVLLLSILIASFLLIFSIIMMFVLLKEDKKHKMTLYEKVINHFEKNGKEIIFDLQKNIDKIVQSRNDTLNNIIASIKNNYIFKLKDLLDDVSETLKNIELNEEVGRLMIEKLTCKLKKWDEFKDVIELINNTTKPTGYNHEKIETELAKAFFYTIFKTKTKSEPEYEKIEELLKTIDKKLDDENKILKELKEKHDLLGLLKSVRDGVL